MRYVTGWTIAIVVYSLLVIITAVPFIISITKKQTAGTPRIYDDLSEFSEQVRRNLASNLELLFPAISTWNRLYEAYSRFQFYSLAWTIIASVLVPILAQAIDASEQAKWFLTLVSVHASVLLAFNKGLAVDDKVKIYRDAQNDFTDLNRTLRANPTELGGTSEEIIANYYKELNLIVAAVRLGEDKPIVLPDPAALQQPVPRK